MTQNFSLYLALRYLRPKRTFVSVITVISVLGVCVGVAALIVVISVMAGFHDQIHKLSTEFDSHIELRDYDIMGGRQEDKPEGQQQKSWRDIIEAVKKVPGVVAATPQVPHQLVLVESKNGAWPRLMWGLQPQGAERIIDKYKKFLEKDQGKIDLSDDGIVIDGEYARRFGVEVGDTLTISAPSNLTQFMRVWREADKKPKGPERDAAFDKLHEMVLPQDLKVTGIFNPPHLQDMSDILFVLVPMNVAQELFQLGDRVPSINIELADPYKAGEVKAQLKDSGILPPNWGAVTWMEQHEQLFNTVQNELEMMYFVLLMIVVVAAFCVMNTMITVTVQKRREIGIIAALGSRVDQIMWVFLHQGMIVGFAGALTGLGAGLLIVVLRNKIRAGISYVTGHEIFSSKIYGLIEIPATIKAQDLAIICGSSFLLCTVAALVPAFLAARTDPAVALRD